MKATVKASDLLDAMQQVAIKKPNKYHPILNGVLIRACEGRLDITTTDLETVRSKSIQADTPEWGTVLVDAKRLLEVLKSLPKEELAEHMGISQGDYSYYCSSGYWRDKDRLITKQGIVFKVARRIITLHAMNVEDYPNVNQARKEA